MKRKDLVAIFESHGFHAINAGEDLGLSSLPGPVPPPCCFSFVTAICDALNIFS